MDGIQGVCCRILSIVLTATMIRGHSGRQINSDESRCKTNTEDMPLRIVACKGTSHKRQGKTQVGAVAILVGAYKT